MNKDIDVLKVVQIMMQDEYGIDCILTEIPFQEIICKVAMTSKFILIEQDDGYYLSFSLNTCSIFDVTFFTNDLTLLLQDKLIPYVEHFIDVSDGMIYFGKHAELKNSAQINKRKGIHQCPICDRYLPVEMFKEKNGYCEICNKITLKTMVFQ